MAKEDLFVNSVDTDALSAHLDRGWDLLVRGELASARVSADRILELDPDCPEGYTLLGAIYAADGDPEEALDAFRRALDVDHEHVDAMLYAAELAIHSLGQIDYAIQLCDEAEELLAGSHDLVEVKVLRAEALLERGDSEKVAAIIEQLPAVPYADPAHYLRVGRMLIDIDQPIRAIELLKQGCQHPTCDVDSMYFLGVAQDLAGDPQAAIQSFLEVSKRERVLPSPRWSQSDEAVVLIAESVIQRFPDDPVGKALRAAALRIQGYPPLELVAEGFDPRSLVFFAGTWTIPPSRGSAKAPSAKAVKRRRLRGNRQQPVLTGIFVYKPNIERLAGSADALAEELSRALAQEAAFFFDLDPADLNRP